VALLPLEGSGAVRDEMASLDPQWASECCSLATELLSAAARSDAAANRRLACASDALTAAVIARDNASDAECVAIAAADSGLPIQTSALLRLAALFAADGGAASRWLPRVQSAPRVSLCVAIAAARCRNPSAVQLLAAVDHAQHPADQGHAALCVRAVVALAEMGCWGPALSFFTTHVRAHAADVDECELQQSMATMLGGGVLPLATTLELLEWQWQLHGYPADDVLQTMLRLGRLDALEPTEALSLLSRYRRSVVIASPDVEIALEALGKRTVTPVASQRGSVHEV
jgi:hypothetical protein